MQYEILNWDSEFFHFNVARITEPELEPKLLLALISGLKSKGIDFVYFPSSIEYDDLFINNLNGILVDKKTTFAKTITDIEVNNFESFDIVESYNKSMDQDNIINLAIQSGEYSRYAVDKKIPREKYIELYSIWMNRSLAKEIAEEVLVIRDSELVVGVITLSNKGDYGDIGLVAVDINQRGKNYGYKLMLSAQKWFLEHGLNQLRVVTQGSNMPACRLYEKCGYKIEKIEYFYHFWLK